jgi:ribonuclease Z
MDLSLFFAGTAGSVPTARRGLPALLIRRGGDRLLFDCGEGTQRQLVRTVGLPEIDAVFLTHFHLDHWLGLPGMLKSFELRDREKPLTLFGPHGTTELLATMRRVIGRLRYPFSIQELGAVTRSSSTGTRSRPSTCATAARRSATPSSRRPGRPLRRRAGHRARCPFGPDFGRLQRGETVNGVSPEQVIGPDRPGRKIVVSGDTAPCEMVRVAAHEADVLVHEATFLHEDLRAPRRPGTAPRARPPSWPQRRRSASWP